MDEALQSFMYCGQRVAVDRRHQVVRVEVDEHGAGFFDAEDHPELSDEEIWQIYDGTSSPPAEPLFSSVAAAEVGEFTPAFALGAKAKAFDDRLVARLESLLHSGPGEYLGRAAFTRRLRTRLSEASAQQGGLAESPDFEGSLGFVRAAAHLLGDPLPQGKTKHALSVRRALAPFLTRARESKPVGIYSATDELQQIFRHDRFCQRELSAGQAEVLRSIIEADPVLLHAYRWHLRYLERFTGPLVGPSLLQDGPDARLFPASDSLEGRLIKKLFGFSSVPEGFELGPELVAHLRDGRETSVPRAVDGFYAHRFHANASLLAPETSGLEVSTSYRDALEKLFLSLWVLDRETHVKQLELAVAGISAAPPLEIYPSFSVEPLPRYYQRMARAYRFLRQELEELFEELLYGEQMSLEDGDMPIGDALISMEQLFAGAEAMAREELGRPHGEVAVVEEPSPTSALGVLDPADAQPTTRPGRERSAAKMCFRRWRARLGRDADMTADMRVAVPVYYDLQRQTVRIAVTLGVEKRRLDFSYARRPEVQIHAPEGGAVSDVEFGSDSGMALRPVSIECNVKTPPSREELRRICDEHREPAAIKAALEGQFG